MAKVLWTAVDCFGRKVDLTDKAWDEHAAKERPYLSSHLEDAKGTVESPDICIKDSTDAYHYYKLGIMKGKHRGTYLRVVVRRMRGRNDSVVTAFASRKLNPGDVVWFKK